MKTLTVEQEDTVLALVRKVGVLPILYCVANYCDTVEQTADRDEDGRYITWKKGDLKKLANVLRWAKADIDGRNSS